MKYVKLHVCIATRCTYITRHQQKTVNKRKHDWKVKHSITKYSATTRMSKRHLYDVF